MMWARRLNHDGDAVGAIHAWTRSEGSWFAACGLLTAAKVRKPRGIHHTVLPTVGCQLCARKWKRGQP